MKNELDEITGEESSGDSKSEKIELQPWAYFLESIRYCTPTADMANFNRKKRVG